MGTYLLGTIYDVIDPFSVGDGKKCLGLKMISMKFASFCLFRISLASLYGFYGFLNLYFFSESFTSFLKIPQA